MVVAVHIHLEAVTVGVIGEDVVEDIHPTSRGSRLRRSSVRTV